MRNAAFAPLAVIGAALAVTLALELASADPDHDMPDRALPLLRPASRAGADTASDPIGRWVATILARPLFSPDRRPVGTESGGPAGLPRLAGVIVGPAGRRAIFAPPGGKPVVIGEGGRVGEWLVRAIRPGEATVVGPGGVQVLHPAFGPAAGASPGGGLPARPAEPMAGAAPARPAAPTGFATGLKLPKLPPMPASGATQ